MDHRVQYGLAEALDMHGDQFSWSASVFYFAFLVWQPGVSYMNQHLPLGKTVSVSVAVLFIHIQQ